MRYVEARLEEYNRDEAYRIFVTKSLQLIPQSKWIGKDYMDSLHPKHVDNRSAEEVVIDVMKNAGLHF